MNQTQLINGNPAVLTILIVEDHREVRASLLEWLGESFAHCRFLEAASGEAALLQALRLPAPSKRYRLWPRCSLMVTVHEERRYQAEADLAGAIFYLPKRQMFSHLIPLLNRMVSQSQFMRRPT
jgi:hypothetical protein